MAFGGTCHGFIAIDPKIFETQKILRHIFNVPARIKGCSCSKAEGQPRIYILCMVKRS